LRVVHLIHGDDIRWGGGIVATWRLQQGLQRIGIESKILCPWKNTPSADSVRYSLRPKLERQIGRITLRLGLNDIHRVSAFQLAEHPELRAADVLHIQGIHGNFFSYLALPKITRAKPTVFTLHDMWALTGHCTYSYDCERWKIGCGHCPYPKMSEAIRRDGTALDFKLKNYTYSRSKMVITAPSHWLAGLARESPLLSRFAVHRIPHGIDTEVYRPLGRELCRKLLGVPLEKYVLLFAASIADPKHPEGRRKGADLLAEALAGLPEKIKSRTVLLVAGDKAEAFASPLGMQVVPLGFISNERLFAIAYSSADLYIFPTRADNMPLTLIESMACGTPMVSFRVGGVPDTVRHEVTGYAAAPEDALDLRAGIMKLLENEPLRLKMSENCRAVAVREHSLEQQARRYAELYAQIIPGYERQGAEAAALHT
jgi:glycosyltransferase involved in cell wall biosynthesis